MQFTTRGRSRIKKLLFASGMLVSLAAISLPAMAVDTRDVQGTFSSSLESGRSIRDQESSFRSQANTNRDGSEFSGQPVNFLENIEDSTGQINEASGELYWYTSPWGSWQNCTATRPSCGSRCGVRLTNRGTEYRYRTVKCRSNNLDSTTGNWSDNFCTNVGMSKPSTSQNRSCSRSRTCPTCPPPEEGGGGGGGGGEPPSGPSSGTTFNFTSYICGRGDSGYAYATNPSTSSYRSKIVSQYRGFSAINRCPEASGYRYWLDTLAQLTVRSYGGNMAAAWVRIQQEMDASAAYWGEGNYSQAKSYADSDCTKRAKQKYGSSFSARYVYNSGNQCRIN